MTRFDTDAYFSLTLTSLDPKRPELTKLARKKTIQRNDLVFVILARDAPEKNEPPFGGSEVNREASNRVARHHPGSRCLDEDKISRRSLTKP